MKKKKHTEIVNKVSFIEPDIPSELRKYDYNEDFKPYLYFFKFLAKRQDILENQA